MPRLKYLVPIGLLQLIGCISFAAPIEVSKPRQLVPLAHGLVGFNSPMGALGEPEGTYRGERLDLALSTLPVQALRFPGGTVANYFDWDTGSLIEQALKQSGKHKLVKNQRNKAARNDGTLPPVDLDSFYGLTQARGIRRFLVLNLLTSPIEETVAVIDRVKAKYPGEVYWELGNELSQDAYRERAFATERFDANVYARLAGDLAAHIERHYPEDRVGVVASETITGRVPEKRRLGAQRRNRSAWDSAAATVEHVDAAIIHPYVLAGSRFLGRLRPSPVGASAALAGLDDNASLRWRWIFACAQELPGVYVERLAARFPGHRIWITEAGLIEDKVVDNPAAQQDMSRLLFNVGYFISWLKQYPAWESFLFHGLFAGQGHMAAFGRDMQWNANTVAYAVLERFLRDARSAAPLDFPTGPRYRGSGPYADTWVRALSGAYVSKDTGDSVLLVNTGSERVDLRLPFANMSTITVGGAFDTVMGGADPNSTRIFERATGIVGLITVPPYSVVLVSESAGDPEETAGNDSDRREDGLLLNTRRVTLANLPTPVSADRPARAR